MTFISNVAPPVLLPGLATIFVPLSKTPTFPDPYWGGRPMSST